jgi:Skp family chaperone for outer membrane proteins
METFMKHVEEYRKLVEEQELVDNLKERIEKEMQSKWHDLEESKSQLYEKIILLRDTTEKEKFQESVQEYKKILEDEKRSLTEEDKERKSVLDELETRFVDPGVMNGQELRKFFNLDDDD